MTFCGLGLASTPWGKIGESEGRVMSICQFPRKVRAESVAPGKGKTILQCGKKRILFRQGDPADAVSDIREVLR